MHDKLFQKFFSDPDWVEVEKMITAHIDPLIKMEDIDLTQPAEHVKAEVIARTKSYNALYKFLEDTRMVNRKLSTIKNPFK